MIKHYAQKLIRKIVYIKHVVQNTFTKSKKRIAKTKEKVYYKFVKSKIKENKR